MDSLEDISKILESYTNDVQESICEAAINVANEGKNKLRNTKNTYHVRTGKYNKGWSVSKEKGNNYIKTRIYNKTDYQLTHLLEHGHVTRNGGRTKAYKHIGPVNDYCINTFESTVEKIIEKGGK